MTLVVYDNSSKNLDRYTVLSKDHSCNVLERRIYLGMSRGSKYISMWNELSETASGDINLGKIVPFSSLTAEIQSHINSRISK